MCSSGKRGHQKTTKRRREEEKSGEQVRQRRYLKPGNAPASGREEKWLT
jgi:hypothetical protein